MKFHIETERLILRELRQADLEGMFELDSNPEVHKYLGNKPVKTIEESQTIIDSVFKQYKERGIGRFAAIEKASGNFIGWSGIRLNTEYNMNGFTKYYDVGYRLIPKYWGKGYASETSFATLHFGFTKLNLETIVGVAETENIASNKVLQKIGLQFKEVFPHEDVKLNWYELKNKNYGKEMS